VILKRQGEARQEVDLVNPKDKPSGRSAGEQAMPEPLCPNGSPVAEPMEPPVPSLDGPGNSPLDQILPQLHEAFSRDPDGDEEGV
jgi:hypothetical protein